MKSEGGFRPLAHTDVFERQLHDFLLGWCQSKDLILLRLSFLVCVMKRIVDSTLKGYQA